MTPAQLTYCDDATGERVELSATELGGWAARVAALLRDGCGLSAGARAAVMLPPHWQTAAVLLGCWSAGIEVSFRGSATAGLPAHGPGAELPLDVLFISAKRADDWLEDVPEARHRFALGLGRPVPGPTVRPESEDTAAGYRDFLTEVQQYPAEVPPYQSVRAGDAATVDGTTYQQWGELAETVAASMGIGRGDRVLMDPAAHEEPYKWLLAPMSVGASIVLCANLDPATAQSRAAAEHATRVL
jgi:uncharacterized protein (TIGR03089 family)